MQVFNAYLKIIRRNLPMLSVYIIAFLTVTVILQLSGGGNNIASFTKSIPKISIVNEDGATPLLTGLADYLAENAELVQLGENPDAQQDALFFRKADTILYIPEGFTASFLRGEDASIQKRSVPDAPAGLYADMLTDAYLNTARLYARHSGAEQKEIAAHTLSDLSHEADVKTLSFGGAIHERNSVVPFFNAASYAVLSLLILGVSTTLLVFRETGRLQRTQCSPLPMNRIHLQSLFANSLYMLAVWLLLALCAITVIGGVMFTAQGALFLLNMLILSLVGLSISYLIGTLIKTRSAQSAVANTLALGMTFLSGGFVPQSLLGEQVLSVARFLPTYWYVRANESIGVLHLMDASTIMPIVYCYLIQLGFAAAMVSLTLVLSRRAETVSVHKPAGSSMHTT
jgi:ABC-2 type transport system permease protein